MCQFFWDCLVFCEKSWLDGCRVERTFPLAGIERGFISLGVFLHDLSILLGRPNSGSGLRIETLARIASPLRWLSKVSTALQGTVGQLSRPIWAELS